MDHSKLNIFMNHLRNDIGIPSARVRVHKDGEEVFSYEYGTDSARPLSYMYSASKPITCVAALQLFEKGKFLLSTPLYDFFPQMRNLTVKCGGSGTDGESIAKGVAATISNDKFDAVPAKNPVTVGQLFTMTAGFGYDLSCEAIKHRIKETDGRFPTKTIVDALAEEPLEFEPGTRWNYSLCHDVLAALVEEISGIKFSQYVKENIFDPLAMNDSTFDCSKVDKNRIEKLYKYDEEKNQAYEIPLENCFILGSEYESGGAGLVSTADNYIKFIDMLTNLGTSTSGVRILSASTVELMRTDFLSKKNIPGMDWELLDGYSYGLGVRTLVDRAGGGSLSPVGEFGWNGAAGAYLIADPENRISVFYGQHMFNSLSDYVEPRLRNIIYSSF